MDSVAAASGEIQTIDCGSALGIAQVAELRARLVAALNQGTPVVLRAGAVEQVETAALQLLLAYWQDAGGRGIPVRWEAPSQSLQQSACLLGISAHLGLSEQS